MHGEYNVKRFLSYYQQKWDKKRLLQFCGYWVYRTTLQLVEDQLHFKREAIYSNSSWRISKQEDLREVCSTQSHWGSGTESELTDTCADVWEQSAVLKLCRYWTNRYFMCVVLCCVHVPQRAKWSDYVRCDNARSCQVCGVVNKAFTSSHVFACSRGVVQ
jgi:hypothetical protein